MAFSYSEKLKARIITYFKQKYGLDINEEQASQYLDSLAMLYSWLEINHTPTTDMPTADLA